MKTKEELKELFSTGKKPTGADFAALIDGVQGPAGTNGEKGDKGDKGAKGDAGLGVKSIALTVNEAGAVTGGTLTFSNDTTAPITVTNE